MTSKFQSLLKGVVWDYSIIVPVDDKLTVIGKSDPVGEWIDISCPVSKPDNVILEFASENGISRGIIALGYPFFNGKDYVWKIRS